MLNLELIARLQQGDDNAYTDLAEMVAEMEYEQPGSSDELYDWLYQEYGLEL